MQVLCTYIIQSVLILIHKLKKEKVMHNNDLHHPIRAKLQQKKKNTNNRASNSRNRLKKKNSAERKKFILIRGR